MDIIHPIATYKIPHNHNWCTRCNKITETNFEDKNNPRCIHCKSLNWEALAIMERGNRERDRMKIR
jgi:hypothetical protein